MGFGRGVGVYDGGGMGDNEDVGDEVRSCPSQRHPQQGHQICQPIPQTPPPTHQTGIPHLTETFAPFPLPPPFMNSHPFLLLPPEGMEGKENHAHVRMGSEGNETDVSDDATIVARPRKKLSLQMLGL